MWKKYLQRIVLVVITILAIKTALEIFVKNITSRDDDTAVVAEWDERITKLITPIPFRHGLVGYISSKDIPGTVFSADNEEGEYILTQYAVAPLILIRGTEQEWNILNVDRDTFNKWTAANADNFELTTSGGGMFLVHKVRK
jgi:hypothetical protein